ncbi:MAG: hypothetical protein FWG66_01155, partial [Spirochaetes bacterium]|nr:hypothetical protein [Spirochaetota bacterium]
GFAGRRRKDHSAYSDGWVVGSLISTLFPIITMYFELPVPEKYNITILPLGKSWKTARSKGGFPRL